MTSPVWMPLYVADYLADTGHLTATEHGAYMLLIMRYWQDGGLPDDERLIARYSRMTPEQWNESRDIIAALFDDGWKHPRIDAELARADEVIGKRRAAAEQKHSKRRASALHVQSTSSDTRVPQPQSPSDEDAASAASSGAAIESSLSQEALDDIEVRLYEAINLDGDPPPSLRDISPILALLDKGYDLDVDVLPKLRAITAKGKRGRSWNYYLPSITEGHEATAAIPAKAQPPPATPLVWVTEDDPRWPAFRARHVSEKGRTPVAMGSKHETGIGSYFPVEWAGVAA